MPLYKYRCAQCGQIMEVLEKMNANNQHACEKCGGCRMGKMMPAFSLGAASGISGGACPTGTCSLS